MSIWQASAQFQAQPCLSFIMRLLILKNIWKPNESVSQISTWPQKPAKNASAGARNSSCHTRATQSNCVMFAGSCLFWVLGPHFLKKCWMTTQMLLHCFLCSQSLTSKSPYSSRLFICITCIICIMYFHLPGVESWHLWCWSPAPHHSPGTGQWPRTQSITTHHAEFQWLGCQGSLSLCDFRGMPCFAYLVDLIITVHFNIVSYHFLSPSTLLCDA